MKDEEKEVMLHRHDKDISALATSVEHLAVGVEATNEKLDNVIDVISTQNIIIERMDNLENNLKESFGRVHDNIGINSKAIVDVRKEQRKFVPSSIIMWGLGIFILYSVAFGTYVVQTSHDQDNDIIELRGDDKVFKSDIKRILEDRKGGK